MIGLVRRSLFLQMHLKVLQADLPHFLPKQILASDYLGIRFYSPQTFINWRKVKLRARASILYSQAKYPRIRKEALDRFRITRFGWQHKRSGRGGRSRRRLRVYQKKRQKGAGFVHFRDLPTMAKYFPQIKLSTSSSPYEKNLNLKAVRKLLPSHIA